MSTITPATRKTTRRGTAKSSDVITDENAAPIDNNQSIDSTGTDATHKQSYTTPNHTFDAKQYTKTPVGGEDTPTRLARLNERNELQSLNARLELYILKQRERDASLTSKDHELDYIKQQAVDEIKRVKKLHTDELNQLRATREQQSTIIAQLESNELQLTQSVNDIKHKYNVLQQQYDDNEQQLNCAVIAQRDAQSQLSILQAQHKLLLEELHQLKHDKSCLDQLYNELNKKIQRLESDTVIQQQTLSNSTTDHELHIRQLTQQIDILQSQLKQNSPINAITRDERDRLIAQYTAEITRIRESSIADKDNAITILKQLYDEKLSGYRGELERSGHELETERSKTRAMRIELKSIDEYVHELQSQLKHTKHRADYAEQALINEKNNPELQQVITQKNEQLRKIKLAFKRKDAEFDELMDVKVLLDSELESYRQLLTDEEIRLDINQHTNNSKRRKQSHLQLQCKNTLNANVVIHDVDLVNHTIVIRSNTTDNIDLYGYSILSLNTGLSYTFISSHMLTIGERCNIVIQLNNKQIDSSVYDESTSVVWKVKSMDHMSNDTLQLRDGENNILSTAVLQSTTDELMNNIESNDGMVDSSISTEPATNNSNCCIM